MREKTPTLLKSFTLSAILILLFLLSHVSRATAADGSAAVHRSGMKPNILVIIGDDMGVETLQSYGVAAQTPRTENLDSLASAGVSFDNFYTQSACSPTRATILTGRYGFRTGIGAPIGKNDGPKPDVLPQPEWASREMIVKKGRKKKRSPGAETDIEVVTGGRSTNSAHTLQNSEFTLPMAFDVNEKLGYRTAAIGKWHLADRYNGWFDHPNLTGFDYFSGLMGGSPENYHSWIEVTNGTAVALTGYTTINKTDLSLEWIKDQGDNPWFLWLAFNLPHNPLHLPPARLLQNDFSTIDPMADPKLNRRPYFEAMIEAMDTEIGRLLDSIDPDVLENTYIVFLGDNGTQKHVIGAPFTGDHAKETLYEGGIHVPLIISGPGVKEGVRSAALINSVDLFSTIMEMAGMSVKKTVPETITHDSVSIMPYLTNPEQASIRDFVFVDQFEDTPGEEVDSIAIRNKTHKLIRFQLTGIDELYNLIEDPYENHNLLKAKLSEHDTVQYELLKKQSSDLITGAAI